MTAPITIRGQYGKEIVLSSLDDVSLEYERARLIGINVGNARDQEIADIQDEIDARALRLADAIPVLKEQGFEVIDIGGGAGSWRGFRWIVKTPETAPVRDPLLLPAMGEAETEDQAWAVILRHNPLA